MTAPSPLPPRSPRVRAKRARRRAEILRAALSAFRERGYHATTLEHIAAQLGIRNTALYHYFPDKEGILYACHQESLAQVERILQDAAACLSPAAGLRHAIHEHVLVMTDTLAGSPLTFEVTALTPDHEAEVIRRRDAYERGLRRLVVEGIHRGEFRRGDPKLTVFAILGAINWVARWYQPDGAEPGTAIATQFAAQLIEGLT